MAAVASKREMEGGRRRTAKCDRQRRDTIVITSAVYIARPQEKLA